jgi:thiol-disulfide isomerase/thioredoxin
MSSNDSPNTPPPEAAGTSATLASRFNRLVVPAIVIIAAVVLALTSIRSFFPKDAQHADHEEDAEAELIGSVVPDINIVPFGSKDSMPLSKALGKVTLINFWATWCEACIVEMPSIRKLHDAFSSQGFKVVAVNLDEEPGPAVIKAIKDFRMNFGVYLDPEQELSGYFDIHAIPFTAIIDQNRKVLFNEAGEKDWNSEEIRQRVTEWLKEP